MKNEKNEIQSQFNVYLDEVLKSLKEFEGITAEQRQSAISILTGFMENLQSSHLPFRDLEKYKSKEIFDQIPAFRRALNELFQFQRSMKIEDKHYFVAVTQEYLASNPLDGAAMGIDPLSDSAKIQKTGSLFWLNLGAVDN